jgi:ornithine racemase
VNYFRVGEALFFAKNLFTGETFEHMHNDVFKLFAEIIEITEKPNNPIGELGENVTGKIHKVDNSVDLSETSLRAILDLGLLDMQPQYLIPEDQNITIVDASSDMMVIDISTSEKNYNIGDLVSFQLKYMGALYLLNSNYIEKIVS